MDDVINCDQADTHTLLDYLKHSLGQNMGEGHLEHFQAEHPGDIDIGALTVIPSNPLYFELTSDLSYNPENAQKNSYRYRKRWNSKQIPSAHPHRGPPCTS